MSNSNVQNAFINGLAFRIGEKQGEYKNDSGYSEVIEQNQLPEIPDIWGWGSYRETDNPYLLVEGAIMETLQATAIAPGKIDHVIVVAAYLPSCNNDLYTDVACLLDKVDVISCTIEGYTLMGCASVLAAISRASDLVKLGLHKNVLVVGIDTLPSEYHRFWNYALFSDAAISCVVNQQNLSGWVVLGSDNYFDVKTAIKGMSFDKDNLVFVDSVERLLERSKFTVEDISKVFTNNVFLPIKNQKDRTMGFSKEQSYDANVEKYGHCLSCDPLLNLVDYTCPSDIEGSGLYLLQSEGTGSCSTLLLNKYQG